MTILVSTRGPKFGRCNICGDFGPLTEDHTPPKGCKKASQVNLLHIAAHLSLKKSKPKGRLSQNGIKYRSLCSRCNNDLLGSKYDPEFIAYVNHVGNYLKTEISLPKIMSVRVKPQKIMRSLLGHMCAQGVDRYDKGKNTDPIKNYFLDNTLPLPANLKIYTWVYPYKGHVMARDCALTDLKVGKPVFIWFLKFYPIAFLITYDEPKEYTFDFVELSVWRSQDIDFQTEIAVVLDPIADEYWPEASTKTSIIMYGQEAITSFEWKK